MTLLTIGGKQVRLARYDREHADPWCQASLAQARKTRQGALCHCTAAPRRLVVRKLGDLHFLAAWPGDAAEHAPSCRFHSRNDKPAARTSVVEHVPGDTGYVVKLRSALVGRLDHVDPTEAQATESIDAQAVRPLQFLQQLWERARLNRWSSGWDRDYWRIWSGVRAELASGRLHTGESLQQVVYMPRPFRRDQAAVSDQEWADFSQVLCEVDQGQVSRRIVLGEARDFVRDPSGVILSLRNFKVRLRIRQPVYDGLFKQFSRPMSAIGRQLQHPSRVMVMAVVQPTAEGVHLDVVDGAFMLCSSMWIPASSGYEVMLANRLVEEDRTFEKPIPQHSEGAQVADFVLLDVARPTALQVFGLSALTYEEKKFATIAQLRGAGMDIWAWRASAGEAMPAIRQPRS